MRIGRIYILVSTSMVIGFGSDPFKSALKGKYFIGMNIGIAMFLFMSLIILSLIIVGYPVAI